jgi:hypothetical protein
MRMPVSILALSAMIVATGTALAHPRQSEPRAVETTAMQSEVARMIESSRVRSPAPNLYLYEWRQSMDSLSGIPPAMSGSTLASPWVDRSRFQGSSPR